MLNKRGRSGVDSGLVGLHMMGMLLQRESILCYLQSFAGKESVSKIKKAPNIKTPKNIRHD